MALRLKEIVRYYFSNSTGTKPSLLRELCKIFLINCSNSAKFSSLLDGNDTRKGFAAHLFKALHQNVLSAFREVSADNIGD